MDENDTNVGPDEERISRNQMTDGSYSEMFHQFWKIIEGLLQDEQSEANGLLVRPEFTPVASQQLRGLKHPGAASGS